MPRLPALAAAAVLVCALPAVGQEEAAGEAPRAPKQTVDATFWGALVFAKPGEAAEGANPVPEETAGRLARAFEGFDSFELLGQHTQGVVFRDYVNWIVPSDEINLELESKGPAEGGGMKVLLKLWQKQKVLVKTDAAVRPGSPVFIAGPEWRDGRLIFVLELR